MLLMIVSWLFIGAGVIEVVNIIRSAILSGVRVACMPSVRLSVAPLSVVLRRLIARRAVILPGSAVIIF